MNYKQTNEKKYNHFFQFCCHCQWCFLVVVFLVVIIANLQRKVCLPKRMIWWWLSTIQSAKQKSFYLSFATIFWSSFVLSRVIAVVVVDICLLMKKANEQKSNLFNYLSSFPNNNQKYSQECFKKQKSKIFGKIFKSNFLIWNRILLFLKFQNRRIFLQ